MKKNGKQNGKANGNGKIVRKVRNASLPKPPEHWTINTPYAQVRGADVWKPMFIEAMRKSGNITVSCEHAGVGRSTVYHALDKDPEFAAAHREAINISNEMLEAVARQRGQQGWDEPVYMRGKDGEPRVVGTIKRYSDRLLEILMKAHMPNKYRENIRTEVSGPSGAPIQLEQKVKVGFDYEGFSSLARDGFGVIEVNGVGEPVHPARADAAAGTLPDDNGS
jgi:hypothetical protein